MASLILKDSIKVETSHETCEVQLMYGSVTKLPQKDEVDVLVISAFPGDYEKTPSSVIGALWNDLRIDVEKLAGDKEEDLTTIFSSWWSKPLPSSPCSCFKRLLCFEGGVKDGTSPPMVISEVFKSLVSLAKGEDITAMMSLLASGDQEYEEKLMLELIVGTAIQWMIIGLPLRVLKVVIYSRNPEHDTRLIKDFQDLKIMWENKIKTERSRAEAKPKYDIYLSYSAADGTVAKKVKDSFIQLNKDIRIFSQRQEINRDTSWPEETYEVMNSCARAITLISPQFLQDESCMEQYNIALCCTHGTRRDYLAPLQVAEVEPMPTHMCRIKCEDCRDFKQINKACKEVVQWLDKNLLSLGNDTIKTEELPKAIENKENVFISYYHRDKKAAQKIQNYLSSCNIFKITAGQPTDDSRQSKLHASIESSRIVIILLSNAYIKSKVFQKEQLSMHPNVAPDTSLVYVSVEKIAKLPDLCQGYKQLNCHTLSDKELHSLYRTTKSIIDNGKLGNQSSRPCPAVPLKNNTQAEVNSIQESSETKATEENRNHKKSANNVQNEYHHSEASANPQPEVAYRQETQQPKKENDKSLAKARNLKGTSQDRNDEQNADRDSRAASNSLPEDNQTRKIVQNEDHDLQVDFNNKPPEKETHQVKNKKSKKRSKKKKRPKETEEDTTEQDTELPKTLEE